MDAIIKDLQKALNFQKQGNFSEAKNIFEKYLNQDSLDRQVNFYYGTLEAITGNFENSIKYFIEAEKINNKNPDLFNNFGLSLHQLGRSNEAYSKIAYAIKLNPNFTNAYCNLASILIDIKDYENAILTLKKCIELDTKSIKAYTLLGIAYYKLQNYDKAQNIFQIAYKINPKYLPLYLNFGNMCSSLGKVIKAEEYFVQAIKLNINYFDAYNNLFDLYERTNQNEKLDRIIIEAKKIFPNNKIIDLYNGVFNYKIKKYLKAIELLEKISFIKKEINRERLRTFFLAKSYDQLDIIDKAFNYFKISNQINDLNKNKNIDKNQPLKLIKERSQFIDNFSSNKNHKKKYIKEINNIIFMIGFPRSGTTLLDSILRSHPEIEVLEEKPLVTNLVKSIDKITLNNFFNFNNIQDDDLEFLREKYLSEKKKFADNKKLIIDKMPLNIMNIVELNKIFPEAKFIVSIRHPFDCVLSSYMQSFELNNSMANFLSLNDAAKFYDLIMQFWENAKQKLNINYKEIKYEDIVLNFDFTITNLLNFLELPWNVSVKKFNETAKSREFISTPSYDQVNQPLYRKSIYRWLKYNKHISEIKPILNQWANKYNYEN